MKQKKYTTTDIFAISLAQFGGLVLGYLLYLDLYKGKNYYHEVAFLGLLIFSFHFLMIKFIKKNKPKGL